MSPRPHSTSGPIVSPAMASLCRRFGLALRMARRRMGYTQEQLAERLDLSANFIAHLERGSRKPSLDTMLVLSTELEVPLEKLLTSEPVSASTSRMDPLVRRLHRIIRALPKSQLKLFANLAESMQNRPTPSNLRVIRREE